MGIAAKLYSGGGEVVAHSSESARHGFGPLRSAVAAGCGSRSKSDRSVPPANATEPMLTIGFSVDHPSPAS